MGISLLNDLAFRYLFGTEEHKEILSCFLNTVLHYGAEQRIVEVELTNPVIIGAAIDEKMTVLDVRARDERGRCYNIEVQVKREPFYVNRVIYYGAKLVTGQLESGDDYQDLCRVISISLIDYVIFNKLEGLHYVYRLQNVEVPHELSDIVEFHFIELPRLAGRRLTDEMPLFEKWLYFIKHSEDYADEDAEVPTELLNEEEIAMALKGFRRVTASEKARDRILRREMAERDLSSRLREARLEGFAAGRAEVEAPERTFLRGFTFTIIGFLTNTTSNFLEVLNFLTALISMSSGLRKQRTA